ncbi:MAG: hypothetical protein ACR2KQ_11250 [Actinomycetota bacterium]
MGDDLRGEEQLDFDLAERVLEEPDGPAERQRPPRYALLRRAGRITATALPVVMIVALGAVNVSLIRDNPDEVPAPGKKTASLPGRESLAEAPGPDALGLRERFLTHDKVARPRNRTDSDNTGRILRGGLTLPTRGAPASSGSGHIASGSSGAPTQGAPASSGSKQSSGTKPAKPKPEPEPVPEPSAVLYRMWNSEKYDHYFTTNPEERDRLLNEGYRTYATEGIIFPTQERGTYPIHTDNGIVGYAFGKQQDNTVPLYFLRGPNGEGDLFTTSTETKDRWQLRHGWDYLGIAGYIGRWGPP